MKKTVVTSGLFPLLLVAAAMGDEPQVTLKPLSIGALQEFGVLGSGHFGGNASGFRNEWVDHFGAAVTQSGDVNDKLSFDVGLGGIFEFQKPENRSPAWGGTQYKDFFMGPSVADLIWKMGPAENPFVTLQFGLFPYKYSSSSNLGEYMFRTGPYPTFIWTGGYSLINNSGANLQGLRLGIRTVKNLSLDLLVTTETFVPPLYDLTLSGIAKYDVAEGLFVLGGGVQLKRIIPIHDYRTSVKSNGNAYFTDATGTYSGKVDYYLSQKGFWEKELSRSKTLADSTAATAQINNFQAIITHVNAALSDSTPGRPDLKYYTTAGTMLMGMASMDFKKLLPSGYLGAEDLKLYGEISVLGWKNYPVFYEKRSDRTPFMVGFNLPAFKLLDLVSVEWEYFHSPWINSYSELGASNGATPDLPNGLDDWTSAHAYNDVTGKDNTSWSILAKKNIGGAITISGQVARDHVRMPSFQSWFGPALDPNEALSTSKDWYWMLQFSAGI